MWGLSYWVFPVVSGTVWLATLITMIVVWNVEGKPHYISMDPNQSIAYISDVGAAGLKPLFITGSVITTLFLDLAFVSERWLRHRGRLAKNVTQAEKVLTILSMIFATFGTVGLVFLSIFDTARYPNLHDVFLLLFIAGYLLSAIFLCSEYQRLGIHYRQHKVLRKSFWIKLFFILIDVVLAVAFIALNFKKVYNAAAVVEWLVAFIFTFYVFSFFIDLLPAVHSKKNASRQTEMQAEENDAISNQREKIHRVDGTANGPHIRDGVNGHFANDP